MYIMLQRSLICTGFIICVTSAGLIGAGNEENGEIGNSNLELCCEMCNNFFNDTYHTCTHPTLVNSVRCSRDWKNGLNSIQLQCHPSNSSSFNPCTNVNAPTVECRRQLDENNVVVNCTWTSTIGNVDGDSHCRITFGSASLVTEGISPINGLKTQPRCNSVACFVIFSYSRRDTLDHCQPFLVSFDGHLVKTAISTTFVYYFNSTEIQGANPLNIANNTEIRWIRHDRTLIIEVPPSIVHSIQHSCTIMSPDLYCHLDIIKKGTSDMNFYTPMQVAATPQDDYLAHFATFCQFEVQQFSSGVLLRLRFSVGHYESEVHYISVHPSVSGLASPLSSTNPPMSFLVIATCILAFPALCGLLFCLVLFRKKCKSPCSVYQKCMEKRSLRRTADWVMLVQTKWHGKQPSAVGVSNSDFQPSTPTSLATDRARSERSVRWPDIEEDYNSAPSLKRPLMRTVPEIVPEPEQAEWTLAPESNPADRSVMSSPMDSCYSDCKPAIAFDQSTLNSIQMAFREQSGELYFRGRIYDSESTSVSSEGMEDSGGVKKRAYRETVSNSDDELSFITAFDVDPRAVHFVESCANERVRKTLIEFV